MAAMKKPTPKPMKTAKPKPKKTVKPKPPKKGDYFTDPKTGKHKMPPGFSWGGKTGP